MTTLSDFIQSEIPTIHEDPRERQGPRLLAFLKTGKDTWDPAAWYPVFMARSYCAIWVLYGGVLVNNLLWISILVRP